MEEMSKKTKRLEKDNMTLTRKHDLTNQNILKMAEERTKTNLEMDSLRKKNEKLTSIIKQMQTQGRGAPVGMAAMAEGGTEENYGDGDQESEYEYEDDEGEDGDGEEEEGDEGSEGDYNEDTEEELHLEAPPAPTQFGPLPPPVLAAVNGTAVNGIFPPNGVNH